MILAYVDSDLEAVVSCFSRSVREVAAGYYDQEQIVAWAPDIPDMDAWARRLHAGGVFVADKGGKVVGFVRVEDNGIVDLLYVHPEYARRGVGRAFLEVVCSWAAARGVRKLESDVSIVARPLFEAMGFRVEKQLFVERRGVRFCNFRMARDADSEQSHAPDRQQAASPAAAGR